jgi:hypothetical protein
VRARAIAAGFLEKYARNEAPSLTENEAKKLQSHVFSKTWGHKWLHKYKYISKRLHGQAASVNHSEIAEKLAKLRDEIAKYDPNNICNMDEGGLNYRLLPDRSFVHKTEMGVRGTKETEHKERFTLYFSTNATGTQKVPLSMIGSSINPRCFGRQQEKRQLTYFHQEKAWSNTVAFKKWFDDVFLPHVRVHNRGRHVLLILDNCGPHGCEVSDPTGQVKIVTLPPNCTSVHQPMDQGIIHAVKKNYQYKMLNKIFENIDKVIESQQEIQQEQLTGMKQKRPRGLDGINDGKQANLYDAQCILKEVWDKLEEKTVACCWVKANILTDTTMNELKQKHGSQSNPTNSEQTMEKVDEIQSALSTVVLPPRTANENELLDGLRGLVQLAEACSRDEIALGLETWTQIEETSEYKQMELEEKSKVACQKAIDAVLTVNNTTYDTSGEATVIEHDESASMEVVNAMQIRLNDFQEELRQNGLFFTASLLEQAKYSLNQSMYTAEGNAQNEETIDDAEHRCSGEDKGSCHDDENTSVD